VGYFFTPVELSLFLSGDAAGVTLSSVVSGWSFMLLRDPLNALFGTADFFLAYIALSICFAPRSFDKSAVKSMLLGLPLIVGFFFKLGAVNSPVDCCQSQTACPGSRRPDLFSNALTSGPTSFSQRPHSALSIPETTSSNSQGEIPCQFL
jgi:hypothetical protein